MKASFFLVTWVAISSATAHAARVLTKAESAKAKAWVGEAQLLDEQSFVTSFKNLGEVWFVATNELPPKSFVYRLYKDEKELTRFSPNHDLCPWDGYDLEAVTFKDFDGDGLEDIGLIAQYITGIGPQGAVPFSMAEIYVNDGKGAFVHDGELHKKLSVAKVETMKDLLRFAKKSEPAKAPARPRKPAPLRTEKK